MFACFLAPAVVAQQVDRELLPLPGDQSTAPENVRFDRPSSTKAITQALGIIQDDRGALWVGDWTGALYRYDGYDVERFVTDPDDSNSLSGYSILGLFEGRDGTIWVSTMGGGLTRYDPKSGSFERLQHDPENDNSISADTVRQVQETSDGYLWASTPRGLDRLDLESGAITHFAADSTKPGSLAASETDGLLVDREGTLWVGSWGLNRFEPESESFVQYLPNPAVSSPIPGTGPLITNWVHQIHEDREGRLWVTTWDGALYEFDRDSGTFTNYRNDPKNLKRDQPIPRLWDMVDDPEHGLWLGTDEGLVFFDPDNRESTSFRSDIRDPFSLSGDDIRTVFFDRQGIMWASAMDRGLNRFDRAARPFQHYYPKPGNPNSLKVSDFGVNGIAEAPDHALWVSSFEVVNRIDRESGNVVRYESDPSKKNSLAARNGFSVFVERNGTVWVGGIGVLDRMDPAAPGRFIHYVNSPDDSTSLPRSRVEFMTQDAQGQVWFANSFFGLSRLVDKDRGVFANYPVAEGAGQFGALMIDQAGIIWVGSRNHGLYRFDPKTETFSNIRSESEAGNRSPTPGQISGITECTSEPGILWLGVYGGGLNRFDTAAGTFRYWTVQNSDLPDNGAQGIYCDPNNRLWLSSDVGLTRYDPATDTFKNFDEDDGLQDNVFNNTAHSKSPYTGEMFFGGPNGVNAFFPEDVGDNPFPPEVVLTGLSLFGERVAVSEDGPLKQMLSDTRSLTLPYNQNDLTLEYVGIHFSNPEENQYAYMLEPYDDHWRVAGTDRTASFTNLDPGEYIFHVKAANSDGVWNEAGTSLSITILPPWWRTWWAYLAYVFLVVGAGVVFWRAQRSRLVRRERERSAIEQAELRAEAAESEARALEADNERKRNVELIGEIGRQITSSLDMDTIFDKLYAHVNELMDADIFGVGLYHPEREELEYRLAIEDGQRYTPYTRDARDENQFPVWCLRNRAPVFINDIDSEYSRYVSEYDNSQGTLEDGSLSRKPNSLIYLPLIAKDKVLGVITVQSFEKSAYTEFDLNILTTLASYTSIALDNADAYRRLGFTLDTVKSMQTQLVTQEKLASLGQLTAGIAHEIKNPLNFVNNFAEMNAELTGELMEDLAEYPEALASVQVLLKDLAQNALLIAQHGKRANGIVQSMMQHATEGSAAMQLTDVNQLVTEHVDLAYHGKLIQTKDLNVKVERLMGDDAGEVLMVPRDIGRVVLNLIGNSIDAVREKAVKSDESYKPELKVRTYRSNGSAVIEVEDNGAGIPDVVAARIFEPFFTTKPAGSGTGLGLSLSHDIVTQGHHGTLSVESVEGEGATFRITLPAH